MSWLRHLPGTAAWRRDRDRRLCRETVRRLQEIVDGEVPLSEAHRLERHLDACAPCGEEAEAIEELKRSIARVTRAECEELERRVDEVARRFLDEERGAR